ncbi:carotenoid oxygenase family protein [Tsukamurella sp. 8F]|uniref:carotenoid oxygenase family protein n=1 Tax=unclassified Tsukamurella TaxID=2633480 RepID=UPI0023B95DEA|nr:MULTISPECIES: carotenoid oxygenase family protein [unclassified Tsukamurella]MDF0530968.1 carotenoid oxygenase family protein [Tsukamurella sp. 8J]MDF0588293.1 carotenoid oxygenase family protein [Tsukamurella sp. 8F]
MSVPSNTTESATHLTGVFAPVDREIDACDLPVTGGLPPDLDGWYVRNGPNPRGESAHWFTGEGMLHGVRLRGGRAERYRNRWVRTGIFEGDTTPLYDPATGERNLHVAVANTHIVRHGGRMLALVESSLPWEVTSDLETVGAYDFHGALADSMTAHPKICPMTGELHFFGYGNLREPYVTYHCANAAGELVVEQPVDVPGLTMMHDFALTRRHVLFLDLPVVFDLALAQSGTMPYRWNREYGARIGVMRRDDPSAGVRWIEIEPCYVFHVANAFEDGGTIVLQAVRYPEMWVASSSDFDPDGTMHEWRIDPVAGTVSERALDDRAVEFPRIDDRRAGLTHEAAWAVGSHHLARYGTDPTVREFGPDRPGEFAYAPSADGRGYLLGYVYRADLDASDLVVLDAVDLATIAEVHLGVRVPAGFHGDWFAA